MPYRMDRILAEPTTVKIYPNVIPTTKIAKKVKMDLTTKYFYMNSSHEEVEQCTKFT